VNFVTYLRYHNLMKPAPDWKDSRPR